MTTDCCRRHTALGHRDGACGPLTIDDADRLVTTGEDVSATAASIAVYHEEHARHGGASWEFHARAQTLLAADVPALARAITAALEQLAEVTAERGELKDALLSLAAEHQRALADARVAREEHRRADEALGRAERRYERREEQIDDIAASLGCERGWTSMHGHETCIDEAVAALRSRADTAERALVQWAAWEEREKRLVKAWERAYRARTAYRRNSMSEEWTAYEEALAELLAAGGPDLRAEVVASAAPAVDDDEAAWRDMLPPGRPPIG